MILSLLFLDDVLASITDHQLLLGRFTAQCEVAGMKIRTSISEARKGLIARSKSERSY